jgi:aarF domain-containing kinase
MTLYCSKAATLSRFYVGQVQGRSKIVLSSLKISSQKQGFHKALSQRELSSFQKRNLSKGLYAEQLKVQVSHPKSPSRSPAIIWKYVIPAIATQGGVLIFSSGIHLEARSPVDFSQNSTRSAQPIPYTKTAIAQGIQEPTFWKRLKQQLVDLLDDYVINPFLTLWRFGVLSMIFLPLILTTPALFIGEKDPELGNERSGAIWWYGLLVKHMELAGPTFIKVR